MEDDLERSRIEGSATTWFPGSDGKHRKATSEVDLASSSDQCPLEFRLPAVKIIVNQLFDY